MHAPPIGIRTSVLVATVVLSVATGRAEAQGSFGASCAGASGVTPQLEVSGIVRSGQPWTLEVRAPGGIGLGYLLVGFSKSNAALLGGAPLPLDLGTFFGDPLWSGCALNVDPSFLILPYAFDPNLNGGLWSRILPGFDAGRLYIQAINIDADFVSRIAGVSRGLEVFGPDEFATDVAPIPAGTFQMGSNGTSGSPYYVGTDETVHTVTLSQSFWMAQYEVTQAEYQAVTGSNPAYHTGANNPVETVSWFDAMSYCSLLTIQESAAGNLPEGYEYRLPTEAEWEYACRAGTTTEFAVGNGVALFCVDANMGSSAHSGSSCGASAPVPVGTHAPNAWGLFDMHGNVREWVLDTYAAYPASPVTDPVGAGSMFHMFRGGGWLDPSSNCRSAHRSLTSPGDTLETLGFRVVIARI